MLLLGEQQVPNLSEVLTWPQAVVAVVAILIVIGFPNWLGYLNNRKMKTKVEDVHHEVHPNSGGSMADSVNRSEDTLQKILATQKEIQNDVALIKERQSGDHQRIKHLEERREHWWNR